jgi:hypothetical protein
MRAFSIPHPNPFTEKRKISVKTCRKKRNAVFCRSFVICSAKTDDYQKVLLNIPEENFYLPSILKAVPSYPY